MKRDLLEKLCNPDGRFDKLILAKGSILWEQNLAQVFAANAQQINIIWVYVSKPGAFEVHSILFVFVL